MKELPLIPSTYSLFDWQSSNGESTAEQAQTAYNALSSQGYTADFSRFVWNDIVDKLSVALSTAGISWNNTYGSAANTKITSPYGDFTANRFNAVRINIDSLIPVLWKWSADSTVLGYLGRPEVRGYAQYGLKGDFVYGWYIIELVRVLNLLLSILKNEANFSEFVYQQPIDCNVKSFLSPLQVRSLGVDYNIESPSNALLYPAPISPLIGQQPILSNSSGNVEIMFRLLLETKTRIRSSGTADITKIPTWALPGSASIKANHVATLIRALYVSRLQHASTIKSASSADLGRPKVTDPTPKQIEVYANHLSEIRTIPTTGMSYEAKVASSYRGDAAALRIGSLEMSTRANSRDIAELQNGRTEPIEGLSVSKSTSLGGMTHIESVPIIATQRSNSFLLSQLDKLADKAVTATNAVRSHILAALDLYRETIGWIDPLQTGSNLYIQSVWSSWREDANVNIDIPVFYRPVQTGSNLYIPSAWFVWSEADQAFVDISLFYTPVQTGSDLYIQSAQRAHVDGDEGYVDMDVYYKPKQTGSDLFITSLESMEGGVDNG